MIIIAKTPATLDLIPVQYVSFQRHTILQ